VYNRILYNYASYNLIDITSFIWEAVATAESGAYAALSITRKLVSDVTALSTSEAALTRIYFVDGEANAESEASALVVRIQFFASEAEAVSFAEASGVTLVGSDFIRLPDLFMSEGDMLLINTEEMTVTLNGENIVNLVSDDSVFFALKPGDNDVQIDADGDADLRLLWKDRWL
jgi:hypothetical protein